MSFVEFFENLAIEATLEREVVVSVMIMRI